MRVQSMRMALTAVSDNGDLLAFEGFDGCVSFRIDVCSHSFSAHKFEAIGFVRLGDGLAATHGYHACPNQLLDAVRAEELDDAIHFDRWPSDFDHQRAAGHVDYPRPIDVGDLHHLSPLGSCFARHLDQRQLALDASVVAQVTDLANLDDFVQLFGDLLDSASSPIDDHGQPHDAGFVGAANRQAFNRK